MDKKNNNYDDGFGYVEENIDDSLENFDDIKQMPRKKVTSEEKKSKSEDYGDNFNSQTGEDHDDYVYGNSYDINSSSYYESKSAKGRKKKANSTAVIILVVCAVICVIFAVIFALTQCTDGNSALKATTEPTISETTVVFTTQAEITQVVQTQAPIQETEAPVVTEVPTEVVTTQAVTETPVTEVPIVTEPSVQEEEPTTLLQPIESGADENIEDRDY